MNSAVDFNLIACGSANLGSGGTYNFFQISEFTNSITHALEYAVESCGTGGGYGSCSAVADQGAFVDAYAPSAAETDYACGLQIMGSSSGIEHIGATANPMQFQNSEGGSWGTHVQNDRGANCGTDYKGDFSSTVLGTYDSRN